MRGGIFIARSTNSHEINQTNWRFFQFHICHHSTVTRSRMARNLLSLNPRTIIRCSARRKGPYCVRCARMRSARTLPTPGSASRSRAEAVLMLIRFGAGRASIANGDRLPAPVDTVRESFTQEQTHSESMRTIHELARRKMFAMPFVWGRQRLVLVLLAGNSVSCMQTNVCEEFRSAPLLCAFCHKSFSSRTSPDYLEIVHRLFHRHMWKVCRRSIYCR